MDKEALTSVGLIGMLLVIVIAATVINSQQQLVATRPQIDSVVSNTLENFLGIEHETEESLKAQAGETTCPLGCTAKTVASPAPEREEQLQSDPIPYVRDQVGEQHATQLQSGELESIYNTDSDLWWRSSEGYRIRTTGAKRVTFQLPTTAVAYTLAPSEGKQNQIHPAIRHPVLQSVHKEITQVMKELDFKETKLGTCPVDESLDPFDNCLAAYVHKRNDQKCLLVAGYGRADGETDPSNPYLRLELSCSDQYEIAHNVAVPYLYALSIIDPPWLRPETAVYALSRDSDGVMHVDLGYTQAYFREIDHGLQLVGSPNGDRTCNLIREDDGSIVTTCE